MGRYRKENGFNCIDLTARDFRQLYDSRDPSPFHERDLDEDLVHYLVMSCEEIKHEEPLKIVVNSPQLLSETEQLNDFILAFHQYFEHELWATKNELHNLFRQGRVSLLFGLLFLMICVFGAIRFVGDVNVFNRVIHEGLIIMGWVALWKPINIFLYEWWPYRRKMRVYKRLSEVKIEFK